MSNERIDLTRFSPNGRNRFYEYLEEQDIPYNNWFIGTKRPKTAHDFQGHVKEAYGNGALTGIQGDYCCLVTVGDYDAIVTLEWDDDGEVQEYYLAIRELKPALTVTKKDLIAELKRCYDFIDSHGLDEDIEHKMVIDLRECSWECLHQLCVQAGVETVTKEEMIARLLE